MNQQMIAAGIVLFNPDSEERLFKCIEKVNEQVSKIYIFDNSTQRKDIKLPQNVVYMTEGKNKGIAYALNRIMEKASADGFLWVLTMDQDSILPDNMCLDFAKYIKKEKDLGIVCPCVIDRRRKYMIGGSTNEEYQYINSCITSASCTSVEAWKRIGGYDEWLFIDLVDNDFCKRLVLSGYKILRLNKWVLDQEFGNIIPKSKNTREFWIKLSKVLHNENIAKFSYKKFVSPLRVYYTNRNIIYLNRKMKNFGKVGYENYNCSGYAGFIFAFLIPSIIRAQDKKRVISATIHGIADGWRSHPVEWNI